MCFSNKWFGLLWHVIVKILNPPLQPYLISRLIHPCNTPAPFNRSSQPDLYLWNLARYVPGPKRNWWNFAITYMLKYYLARETIYCWKSKSRRRGMIWKKWFKLDMFARRNGKEHMQSLFILHMVYLHYKTYSGTYLNLRK